MSGDNAGLSPERLKRIGPAVERHIGADKMSGAVTLVARRGVIVHNESYGLLVRETAAPMRRDAIFRIYSMTKPITCVALMENRPPSRFGQGYCPILQPPPTYNS